MYSTVLKEHKRYKNVMVLEGGVQAYFEKFGNEEKHAWDDHLFVFDNRLAMTPKGTPAADLGEKAATLECHVCKQKNAPPPHRNCPNVDCNRLFLVCEGCSEKLDGFCCQRVHASDARATRSWSIQGGIRNTRRTILLEARAARRGDGRQRRKQLRLRKRKLACAEYVIRTVLGDDEVASSSNESSSGTFAARTRSNNKVAENDDEEDEDDDEEKEEEEEEPEEWDGNRKREEDKAAKFEIFASTHAIGRSDSVRARRHVARKISDCDGNAEYK